MKGHAQSYSNNGNGGGRKGRMYAYGLMVVLAFGAAMFGGMLLHKLRDTQLLNLLLSHKDRHLLSLQLLLQKERAYASETKRKSEQMKAKIYSLRTQKTELSSKILKMQSTISSLKEELRTMESTLEEKQNEIKLLREKRTDSNNENPQVTALSKTLKQREAEIEDFKHRFDLPVKVWSVSTDDPSNPTVNLTVKVTTENGENYRDKNSMIESDVSGNSSVGSEDRENSTQDEDSREMNGKEQFQQRKNSREGEITREKRRRFFKDESESERGDRIHDGELKGETEHQDHDVINMTNKSVEKKRYIEHFK